MATMKTSTVQVKMQINCPLGGKVGNKVKSRQVQKFNNTTMVEPVASLAARLLCFEPLHPRETLREGLARANSKGLTA
jgi:hypothetical protein